MAVTLAESIKRHLGWCPNAPTLRTAPAVLMVPTETIHAEQPGGSGPADRSGPVRQGVSIATGSLREMIRNRYLLGFSFLSGLAMFFLNMAEIWDATHFNDTLPFPVTISVGNVSMVFDPWFFLVEAICLFCFTLLLAGVVLHRNADRINAPFTIRDGFTGVRAHIGPLSVLSIALALIATMVFAIISQSEVFGRITGAILFTFFSIPSDYVLEGMINPPYFAFIIMFVSIIPFLIALSLVPAMVLEKKGLVPALAGSIALIQRTWREVLGCILVYGTIILFVAVVWIVIVQVPGILYDSGFHLSMYIGHLLMTVVINTFTLACLFLMAAGFSAAGVAIADLYRIQKSDGISGLPGGDLKKPEPAS
jgi:hypothetical protein